MKISNRDELISFIQQGNRVKYVFFWGHRKSGNTITKSCFSQWYDAAFEHQGKRFATAEHYMMYQKAKLFGQAETAERILQARNPGEAKALGREVRNFDESVWLAKRFGIVVEANLAKFSSHPQLANFLLNTGTRVLVEASPIDIIWGVGLAADHPDIENPYYWRGQNLLGFALMEAREQLSELATNFASARPG